VAVEDINNEMLEDGRGCCDSLSRRIVTTNGCFDILHLGHIETFRIAKQYGNYLIVCLNSDDSVRRLKGEGRPVHNQDYRKRMLESIRYVDEVKVFNEDDPRKILDEIKPMVHIKSKTGYKGIEKEVVERNGGKIVLVDDVAGFSSTYEIEKIKKLELPSHRPEFLI
jgi:rfaE bifunctional protein nucleotidyltransferase chain/domain